MLSSKAVPRFGTFKRGELITVNLKVIVKKILTPNS
jgi:hypothetical protein